MPGEQSPLPGGRAGVSPVATAVAVQVATSAGKIVNQLERSGIPTVQGGRHRFPADVRDVEKI